jgi:biotin carboxylase
MSQRKRLLLIAATTGYQTRVFAEAGQRLGLDVVLATDRCHVLDDPWGDQAIAVRFEKLSWSSNKLAASGAFSGVAAVGDRPALLASIASQRLGLHFHSPEAVEAARNKHTARERFRSAGMLVPGYTRVLVASDPVELAARVSYPCVLKPLGLSASRGVIRADDPTEFIAAFKRIRAILDTAEIRRLHDAADQYIQIEDFIPGREYALEGLVTNGRLQVLALFDKPDPLDGPYFEETIYVTPPRAPAEVQRVIVGTAQRAVDALGLNHGPVHAEMRVNQQGVWMLEVAPRPIGGLCARCLQFDDGVPLEELLLRHAIGEDVSSARLARPASGVMMIPIPSRGVYVRTTGEQEAAAVPGIEAVMITAKEGQELIPLPEGSSYLGFIFAACETAESVESALRKAHSKLDVEIARSLSVQPPSLTRAEP